MSESPATPARRPGRWMALAIAAALLGTGLAAGVAVDRLLLGGDQERRGRPRGPEDLLERYRERLDLDDEQARAVGEILRRRWGEAQEVARRFEPEMDAIRQRANDEVRALLRPEQQPAFDEIVRQQEERRAAIRRRRAPPPR